VNNFRKRIITGTIFIAAILGSIWWGPLSFQVLFFIAALCSLQEFYKLVKSDTLKPNFLLGFLIGAISYLLISISAFSDEHLNKLVLLAPLSMLIFIAELYRKKENPFGNIGYTILGIFYIIIPFALLSQLAAHQGVYDRGILFGFFFLVWSNDSFAYVFGNLFGKHKLFERISPKKSWEGVIGGGISTLGIAYLLSIYQPQIGLTDWLMLAIIIVITGILGDLIESLLKRSLGVKDSGTILPGHGGFLDRFDALFLSVPFVWAYISYFVNN